MNLLRRTSFDDILASWGLHEGRGFISANRPPDNFIPPLVRKALNGLHGDQSDENAETVIRWWREPVIAQIESAIPYDCLAAINSIDAPSINVMGGRRLIEHANEWNSREDKTGDWVRHLAKDNEKIGGPFLAVARETHSQLTLLDGLHRAAAWVYHLGQQKDYPIIISIVLTRNPVTWELTSNNA
jgi:hypothetical protein